MNLSAPFIRRPVATTLLTFAIALGGLIGFFRLPAAPMPDVDLPSVAMWAQLVGASPETMAAQVAAPLERQIGVVAGVREVTSYSKPGATDLEIGFALGRDLNGAARDLQAAINAAGADLPSGLAHRPGYFKGNLADWPVTYVSLTSDILRVEQIYHFASTVLLPQLASIEGVTWVYALGSTLPAVRVELDADALSRYGIGLESIRAALAAANANSPKGAIEIGPRRLQIMANDRARRAEDYRDLVVAYREGRAVRLADVAEVVDSVEDFRPIANTQGESSILIRVFRTPGANVIETVDRIKARLDQLRPILPPAIDMELVSDRTATIRAALRGLEHDLVVAAVLVVLTVLAFLQSLRAVVIPAVVVPASLLGTFGVMHVLGYSLDSLSLMALIIATGLVIDDSVVVVENISRHIEAGVPRIEAAMRGAREVAFTVLAMSLSLVAAFLPLLLMGDVVGRIFRAFSVTLSVAVIVSLIVSLTTAPMLAALVLRPRSGEERTATARVFERGAALLLAGYDHTLALALRHERVTLGLLAAFLGLNVYLYAVVPKGLLPQQDPGRLFGTVEADQSTSFAAMHQKFEEAANAIKADGAVARIAGLIDPWMRSNIGFYMIELKAKPERQESAEEVKNRLSARVAEIPGLKLTGRAPQDITISFSIGSAGQYEMALKGDDLAELRLWTRRLVEALERVPQLAAPAAELLDGGLETKLVVDRDKASRLGVSMAQIDNTLYDAFGQRQVTTVHELSGQHRVVMELAPRFWGDPTVLDKLFISTSGGPASGAQLTNAPVSAFSRTAERGAPPNARSVTSDPARNQSVNALANSAPGSASTGAAVSLAAETMTPLSAFAHVEQGPATLSVIRKDNSAATIISFNLAPGVALSEAIAAIERTIETIGMPSSIRARFSGAAKTFQETAVQQTLLIFAALATIYIILGVLYESFIHPLTILSTLPSAGVGAILALMAVGLEFTVIAFIGVILLIGIVMKNAIMMIDVAVQAQRVEELEPTAAIHKACLLRFRPIMMTTFAALFAALPLALGTAEGAELRQPLGISIIGGLLVSQFLTLYTTPVVYLALERFSKRSASGSTRGVGLAQRKVERKP